LDGGLLNHKSAFKPGFKSNK